MKHLLFIIFFPFLVLSQNTITVKGIITNKFKDPVEGVAISYAGKGTTTNKDGFYQFKLPAKETTRVSFSHVAYKTIYKSFIYRGTEIITFNPRLKIKNQELKEIILKNRKKEAQGLTNIKTKKVKNITGANAGIEAVLMTLPGVSNNNELSTQYNVRGGNFDENLVYVNGIEVYRPFLIRSGQQEGLSFINTHMIKNINFSAGGFQAKYGDKLSSVLDITYRKPKKFQTQLDLSLLGGSATVENSFLENKLNAILGVRYRDNSLFVNSKQTQVNFKPQFTDVQSFLSYQISPKINLNFLGNFSLNNYKYKPLTRKTRFGTFDDPLMLVVFYNGQEQDQFKTIFGALSADFKINQNLTLTSSISSFNTQEEEYFDISAQYNLGKVNTSIGNEKFGDTDSTKGIGGQISHARNDLDALITSAQIKASLKDGKNRWLAGIKFRSENFKDRLNEWEIIDSVGFAVHPPSHSKPRDEPYNQYTAPITPFQNIKAKNNTNVNRASGFIQFSRKTNLNDHQLWFNFGLRSLYWNIIANDLPQKNYYTFSPRGQFAIKPDWKTDMLFRISGGWYAQPPLYKELRNNQGKVNPKVKAQQSLHIVAANEYSFSIAERPFKLVSEIYYKNLTDVNTYSVDNVRVRYNADNNSKAYAYGLDLRLNGEFVPGNDSWISFGYLKTEENINNRGYIARPTDQRLKFGMLFQDYIPNLPDMRIYLNLVYNTGVPGGAPAYTDIYNFQNRLNDYKRADIGISYVFTDANKQFETGFLKHFKELTAGIELFNIFDIKNSITNTWVRDVYSKRQYGIPNYMTSRVINFKLKIKF